MRTKGQRSQPRITAMPADLKSVLKRSSPTLIQDAAGAAALVVMLLVALHLPGLI
jgi:hypothetical protein